MLNEAGRLALAAAACWPKQARRHELDRDAGKLVAQGRLPANADPVEEWLYTPVKGSAAGASGVIGERAEPILGPLRDCMRERALMLTNRQTASMRWQRLWFAPLLALGAARIVAETANHKPVLYLLVLMLLILAVAISLCRLPRSGVSTSSTSRLFCLPRSTSAGARALAGMRAAPGGEGGSAAPGRAGLARTVALNGLGAVALADAAFASMLGVRSGSGWCSGGGWGGGGFGGGGCGG